MKNINILKTLFLGIKNLYVYRFSKVSISKKSKISILGKMKFNIPHGSCPTNKTYSYLNVRDDATLIVKNNFVVRPGCRVEVLEKAKLEIDDCRLNYDSKIYCFNNIKIGKNVIISENVIIRDSDNHQINDSIISKPIVIEDDVWIGMGAIILKGVTIKKGAVIAAGAVVTKDVLENTLVGGNPARVIKDNIKWNR